MNNILSTNKGSKQYYRNIVIFDELVNAPGILTSMSPYSSLGLFETREIASASIMYENRGLLNRDKNF